VDEQVGRGRGGFEERIDRKANVSNEEPNKKK
jgi:hypothetical protein